MSSGADRAREDALASKSDADAACESALMECRICWHVYDPASGDDLGQVAPGTPFSEVPDDWRCPNCDADKDHFLAVDPAGS